MSSVGFLAELCCFLIRNCIPFFNLEQVWGRATYNTKWGDKTGRKNRLFFWLDASASNLIQAFQKLTALLQVASRRFGAALLPSSLLNWLGRYGAAFGFGNNLFWCWWSPSSCHSWWPFPDTNTHLTYVSSFYLFTNFWLSTDALRSLQTICLLFC